MKLFTKAIEAKLLKNGEKGDVDLEPVVKVFTPDANATWLLASIDPENPDLAFGLCDLGLGFPELGYVSLSELRSIRGRFGLPVERDRFFKANKKLSEYASEAESKGAIIV